MTDIDLAAIRERYAAWKRISDAGNDDLGEGTVAMVLAGNDVPRLLAEVERLAGELAKAQWHQERCHAHHIASDAELAELRRTSQQSIDARDRLLREATAERDTLRAVAQGNKRHVAYLAAVVERVRVLADEHAEHADGCGLLAGQILDALSAAEPPHDPGVDTGTGEARTAGSGDTAAESEPIPAELSTHYGPTATDPEPGKEWHYDCGGEVYSFKEGRICAKCGQAEDGATPSAHPDPLAEAIASYFREFSRQEGAVHRHEDFAEGLIEALAEAGWNLDAIGHPKTDAPRTWALPDEPGPEVTAVRAKAGRVYRRVYDGWRGDGLAQLVDWHELLRYAPLTDATAAADAPGWKCCENHG